MQPKIYQVFLQLSCLQKLSTAMSVTAIKMTTVTISSSSKFSLVRFSLFKASNKHPSLISSDLRNLILGATDTIFQLSL